MRTPILQTRKPALSSLRKRWLGLVLFYGVALLLSHNMLDRLWRPGFAFRWAALAAPVLVYLVWFLWTNLDLNHRPAERTLLPTLGAGTGLSLLRGLCIGLLAGFLFSPRPPGALAWAPAMLYTLSLLGDYFDGYLARIANHVSLLGKALDMELDVVEKLVVVGLVMWYGTLPWWFFPLGLHPYALVSSLWLLRRLGRPVYQLPSWMHSPFGLWLRPQPGRPVHESPRRQPRWPIAGMMRGYLSVMLWPIVAPPASTLAGLLFALPFFARFIYHWLALSGTVDPRLPRYVIIGSAASTFFLRWLPLPLRGILVWVVLSASLVKIQNYPDQVAHYAALGFPFPGPTVAMFASIELLGSMLIGLGIVGRYAAIVLLIPVGLTIMAGGLSPELTVALVAIISILILDTGALSLWQPDDRFFRRRPGDREG